MRRVLLTALTCCLSVAASSAEAGVPRGLVLAADEQIADEATGTTVARGNAELTILQRAILGRADTIEVSPPRNEIIFKGGAVLAVGRARYQSETVSCTLDFSRCAPVNTDASAAQPVLQPQTLPENPPEPSTAAVTTPR